MARHGNGFVVIGTNWGGQKHPARSGNLLANPDVTAIVRGRTATLRGRLITGEERERLWAAAAAVWPTYNAYANRAGDRELRVFMLEPA